MRKLWDSEKETFEVDKSCDCKRCTSRTTEFYRLDWTCPNCSQGFIVKLRMGDKPGYPDCPWCGVMCFSGKGSYKASGARA